MSQHYDQLESRDPELREREQLTALAENEDVKEFYLGVAEGRRKSFREGKHYKRRKRWLA